MTSLLETWRPFELLSNVNYLMISRMSRTRSESLPKLVSGPQFYENPPTTFCINLTDRQTNRWTDR